MRVLTAKLIAFCLCLLHYGFCDAAVRGLCSDCHTMHNSQGGVLISAVALPGLLVSDCVGCHTGVNTQGGNIPYVLTTGGAANYGITGTEGNTLAGGNFSWVSTGNDTQGHNVSGLTGIDINHGLIPPGGIVLGSQITCAGTNGCHGDPSILDETESMEKTHHHGLTGSVPGGAGAETLASYRFLKEIAGYEDQEWEFTPTNLLHNQYKGRARVVVDDDIEVTTISHLCARCHGDFHNSNTGGTSGIAGSSWGSPWIRHPNDFDIANVPNLTNTEYNNYGGAGINEYNDIVPLASSDISVVVNAGVLAGGKGIIMCLTCHRAHGTPYDGLMRWNYKDWPGAGGYAGCQVCHSSKN